MTIAGSIFLIAVGAIVAPVEDGEIPPERRY